MNRLHQTIGSWRQQLYQHYSIHSQSQRVTLTLSSTEVINFGNSASTCNSLPDFPPGVTSGIGYYGNKNYLRVMCVNHQQAIAFHINKVDGLNNLP